MSLWRILVVDDEAGMLRSVERVLGKDYNVATARSPRESLGLARTFKPDLAILDIQMPEMDGFQLMEELQALDPELDVIFHDRQRPRDRYEAHQGNSERCVLLSSEAIRPRRPAQSGRAMS